MAETLQILSIISFAVAGVCFVLAVFFWFFFKIPTVIGDLSGRTARKSIAKMRVANEKSGSKSYKESKVNLERGKLTGTMPQIDPNPPRDENETADLSEVAETQVNSSSIGSETTGLLLGNDDTAPLYMSEEQAKISGRAKKIEILEEIMFIHTEEVIE